MAKHTLEREIQLRVAAFAAELQAVIRDSVLASIVGSLGVQPSVATSSPPPATGPAPRARRARGRKGRAAAGTPAAAAIGEFVAKNPGSRLEHIAAGLGVKTDKLKKTVAAMLAAGQLSKTGQKRGTQYHPGKGGGDAATVDPNAGSVRRRSGPVSRKKGKRGSKRMTKKKAA
jgi:hypothetical protein